MNPNARHITVEVLVNDEEKNSAVALCKTLGIGLSTWYRGLGNAEVRRHGMPPAPPKEPRGCPGRRANQLITASRASAALTVRRRV